MKTKQEYKQYVLGFLFNRDLDHVLLIKKQKPSWQKGLLNGLGGLIELKETPDQALIREFKEESGLDISNLDRKYFCSMDSPDYEVFCYYILDKNSTLSDAKSLTVEEVNQIKVDDILNYKVKTIRNIQMLINMALTHNDGNNFFAILEYKD